MILSYVPDSPDEFVTALQSMLGESLRGVVAARDGEYDPLYERDDVRGRYLSEDVDRVHQQSLLADEPREDAENVFRAGSLNFAIYTFDAAIVLQFPDEDGALFVSFDDGDVPLLPVVDECSQWIRTRE